MDFETFHENEYARTKADAQSLSLHGENIYKSLVIQDLEGTLPLLISNWQKDLNSNIDQKEKEILKQSLKMPLVPAQDYHR